MNSERALTIGELAKAAGVASSTIRFYERGGLLRRPVRSGSGYRQYGQQDVQRVRFIRSAQAMGLTLSDIRLLLEYADGEDIQCGQVRVLLEGRLEKVEGQLHHLGEARQALQEAIKLCASSPRMGRCKVIDAMTIEKTDWRIE